MHPRRADFRATFVPWTRLFPSARLDFGYHWYIFRTCCHRDLYLSFILGTPTLDEFHSITSRRSREYIRALPIKKPKSFSSLFPHASADAIDFLSRTLVGRLLYGTYSVVLTAVVRLLTPRGGCLLRKHCATPTLLPTMTRRMNQLLRL